MREIRSACRASVRRSALRLARAHCGKNPSRKPTRTDAARMRISRLRSMDRTEVGGVVNPGNDARLRGFPASLNDAFSRRDGPPPGLDRGGGAAATVLFCYRCLHIFGAGLWLTGVGAV